MKIGILGTGSVGQSFRKKFEELGHEVVTGSRNGRDETLTFDGAAARGDIIFNCIKGEFALEALGTVDPGNLSGKTLIDVSNPLDFSEGMPPSLLVCNKDSLGEQLQKLHAGARVIKAFNTLTADLMVNPALLKSGHDLFICGDDEKTKESFREFIRKNLGWESVIDLGGIKSARAMEMILPLWVNLYMNFQSPMFNFKIVRD